MNLEIAVDTATWEPVDLDTPVLLTLETESGTYEIGMVQNDDA